MTDKDTKSRKALYLKFCYHLPSNKASWKLKTYLFSSFSDQN